jgi:hypothetical protein
MPAIQQAKLGNWVHLHQHPAIPSGNLSRVAFCGAFFVSGQLENLQTMWAISTRRKDCALLF